MTATRMPSVDEVSAALRDIQADIEPDFTDDDGNIGIDVRLQVLDDGSWELHMGDASYDTDHHGYWGASFIAPDDICAEVAADLIGQCEDHAAQCGEGD